jgi:hypothetical protein
MNFAQKNPFQRAVQFEGLEIISKNEKKPKLMRNDRPTMCTMTRRARTMLGLEFPKKV